MNSDIEELESLLFEWEAGSLSEDGVERVREILRSDDAARTHFVRMQMMGAVAPVTAAPAKTTDLDALEAKFDTLVQAIHEDGDR